MGKKINKYLYWTPRILSIIFIAFLALMSLDVFSPGLSIGQIALGLFMHNIPVFILIIVLVISWKYEWVGGVIFILAGLLYTGTIVIRVIMSNPVEWYMLSWSLIIAGPAFFIGILFLINWFKKRK